MVNTIHKTGMLKVGNDIDRELSYEIQEAIEQYEEEINKEIKFMAIRYRNTIECDKYHSIKCRIIFHIYMVSN